MAREKQPSAQRASQVKLGGSWYQRFPWIAVLGSILIFVSWVFENKYANEATEERLRLERSQMAIDLQQIRMEQWQILYLQEKSKPDPDQKIVMAAAFKALQSYANLVSWSFARVRDAQSEAARDIQDKNQVQDNLIRRYKAGDVAALEEDLKNVATIESQLGIAKKLSEKFNEKYAKVTARKERITWIFLAAYVLGSVMVGVDFMLKLGQQVTKPELA